MQKWLDNNDIFMYLPHNESKSIVAEKFTWTWKGKTNKPITASESQSYLGYLNKLVDE